MTFEASEPEADAYGCNSDGGFVHHLVAERCSALVTTFDFGANKVTKGGLVHSLILTFSFRHRVQKVSAMSGRSYLPKSHGKQLFPLWYYPFSAD